LGNSGLIVCLVKSYLFRFLSAKGLVRWMNIKGIRPYLFWNPPDSHSLKWNVNGYSKAKLGPAGIGEVLRVHLGAVRCVFSCLVGDKDSKEAELLAVVKDIELSS